MEFIRCVWGVKISNILFFVDRRPLLWEKTPKFCLPIKPHKWLKIRVLRKNLKKGSEKMGKRGPKPGTGGRPKQTIDKKFSNKEALMKGDKA